MSPSKKDYSSAMAASHFDIEEIQSLHEATENRCRNLSPTRSYPHFSEEDFNTTSICDIVQ